MQHMRYSNHLELLQQRSCVALTLFLTVVVLIILPNGTTALFGFGGGSQASTTADAAGAKARAIGLIRAKAAADDFVPPAAGVGRQDAARYAEARAKGQLACLGDGGNSAVMVDWAMVNDDFCDCLADGSDEPGTASCSRGGGYLYSAVLEKGLCCLFRVSVCGAWVLRTHVYPVKQRVAYFEVLL